MKVKLPLFLVIIAFTVIYSVAYFFYSTAKPVRIFATGAKFGSVSISGQDYLTFISTLDKKFASPVYLDLESSSRSVTLADMGIGYDAKKLASLTQECRDMRLFHLCGSSSMVENNGSDFITMDAFKLQKFLSGLEDEYAFVSKNTIISYDNFTFRSPGPHAKVHIDSKYFSDPAHLADLISVPVVTIPLTATTIDSPDAQKASTESIAKDISVPLLVKYGRSPINIPTKSFISTLKDNNITYGIISSSSISKYLDTISADYESSEVHLVKNDAVFAIQNALLLRSAGYPINNAVILPIEGKPETHGEAADVYLEVIKSQQRMYRFERGNLVKTYIISTGLTWETPPGTYKIEDKFNMSMSYFGNWYMPHFMPVGLVHGSYRFGFHEIPYHMDSSGNIYSRDQNTMGSPATGGCIQLTKEDATELYDWAWIGIPVYIYE